MHAQKVLCPLIPPHPHMRGLQGKARFVSDCASYIQSCMKPATDIFISGHEMVASIVVLPLIYKGQTFGGFYGEPGAVVEVQCCGAWCSD